MTEAGVRAGEDARGTGRPTSEPTASNRLVASLSAVPGYRSGWSSGGADATALMASVAS
jgi:hypothetical protein